MKKQLLNFGKALSSSEQKKINGGFGVFFDSCSNITTSQECLSNPTCAWNGSSCYTKTPHIV
ncbi:hypothetical protein [Dokdonia pacifica]|uniref:Uncharacterized protein n=1 Tax=Dokdonia pacifica TaxID=1627892 RepID=A0A239A0U0_9FLAO|nr:hypothetical protein [Dokdonia pacifica]SNR89022.1 hypothetical protein SAMN06265376_10462 [Dokdonia pacifica]